MALWGNKDSKTASGTITIAADGAVTGTSTAFTTEADTGNTIRVGSEDYQIVAIASDTACTVRSGIAGATLTAVASTTAYTLSEKPASARMSSANDSGLSNVFGVDNTELVSGGDNVTAVSIANPGTRYLEVPGVTVAAPAAITVLTTAVNTTADTITVTNHRYLTGTKLTYTAGGTAITGLTNATAYFVIRVDANTFKLASSLANAQAGTAIDLTGTGNNAQTFVGDTATVGTAVIAGGAVTSIAVTGVGSAYLTAPTITVNKPRRIIPTSGVTIATEQFAYTAHGLLAGESVKYFDTGSTAVTGLSDNTEYFVSALGLAAGTFRLATTALASAGRANLTSVTIDNTTGGFTCDETTLAVGDHVVISGPLGGFGTIDGYTSGKIYEVSAVTGTSPNVTGFTLTEEDTTALTTTDSFGVLIDATVKPYTIVLVTGTGNNAQYFEIQNAADQATILADLGSGDGGLKATHAGWVKRTVGTGGRAGRVQTEVLVAMGSITGDQADDIQYPDA
jgi:hypothetical protein